MMDISILVWFQNWLIQCQHDTEASSGHPDHDVE
jgi:hypothetical protein